MPSSSSSHPKLCTACGEEGETKKCSGCKRSAYCSKDCQRKDWRQHKKVCFPNGSECTRCLETINDSNFSQCTVPHPPHLVRDNGSCFGKVKTWNFICNACQKSFAKTSSDYNREAAPITSGAKHCYCGPHTTKPLEPSDQRRVCHDILSLHVGEDLQKKINEIPSVMPNVRILTIESTGCFEEDMKFRLEVPMPKLEVLKIIDVAMEKVKLNPDLTPLVQELMFQNINRDCDLTVLLPNLKDFTIFYYECADYTWLKDALTTAKKLESFDSYKLWVGPALRFASNDLISLRLHRADILSEISIYAPRLAELNLQACYDIERIHILEEHPDFSRPSGKPSTIIVETTNAVIPPKLAKMLVNHPRVEWDGQDEEDDDGFGAPMFGGEGMQALMQQYMQSFQGLGDESDEEYEFPSRERDWGF